MKSNKDDQYTGDFGSPFMDAEFMWEQDSYLSQEIDSPFMDEDESFFPQLPKNESWNEAIDDEMNLISHGKDHETTALGKAFEDELIEDDIATDAKVESDDDLKNNQLDHHENDEAWLWETHDHYEFNDALEDENHATAMDEWTAPSESAYQIDELDVEAEIPWDEEFYDELIQRESFHPWDSVKIYGKLIQSTAGGITDANKLTDLSFFAIHPERNGKPLSKDETDFTFLVNQWKEIKNQYVLPFLESLAHSKKLSKTRGPLTTIDVQMPFPIGNQYRFKKNTVRIFGISKTIDALKWITTQWHKKYPEIQIGIGDISQKGGGDIGHLSHRIGLDADMSLNVRSTNKRIGDSSRGVSQIVSKYKDYRHYAKAFVDVTVSNPFLPVKVIWFFDHKLNDIIPNSSQSRSHYRHFHIRFCMPESHSAQLNLKKVYEKGKAIPNYTCKEQSELQDDELVYNASNQASVEHGLFEYTLSETGIRETIEYNINGIIDDKRDEFNVSEEDEAAAAKSLWGKNKLTNTLGSNGIEKAINKMSPYEAHIQYSQKLFDKTALVSFKTGRDVNFVIAIATREGGTKGVFKTGRNKVVSSGSDVHEQGVSGLDYLYKQAKHFKEAGIPIWKVPSEELKPGKQNRLPAIVYAKHLLFSHMVEVAQRERTAWKINLKVVLSELGETGDPMDFYRILNKNARRAWTALTYSGGAYVRGTLRYIIKDQQHRGLPIDFNAIISGDLSKFSQFKRVILARATSLRAYVFDQLV